jgi:small-conductance mechanosensitive channel
MRLKAWIPGLLLWLLMVIAFLGWRWTREIAPQGETPQAQGQQASGDAKSSPKSGTRRRERRVNERLWITANRMAILATTPEEQPFVTQALRLANHEVDLAFADAIRTAASNPPPDTPEIKQLTELKEKAEATLEADEQRVRQLTRALEAAREQDRDALEGQLEVAKAQLELSQDELEEAASDLEQAGGDPQARIQRLKAAHEAAQKDVQTLASQASTQEPLPSGGSLLGWSRQWNRLRNQGKQLTLARKEVFDRAQRMSQRHAERARELAKNKEEREAVRRQAAGATPLDRSTSDDTVWTLKQILERQKSLSDMGRRLQDMQELTEVYDNWSEQVETRKRAALHKVLAECLGVLGVLMAVFLLDRLIDYLTRRAAQEQLRATTLSTLARFGIKLVGLLVIVFICFGVPSQLTTILGLAGAGLTVAMKDFIVAFFGWFVLMGRHGIRVGDWVEIKGVGGEVVEIGLMHTVLLETGSWTDAGHPTGRRVSFVNSFAVEGHYFNFSTTGQWMWDELSVVVPSGQDPYPIIDGIQKRVEEETRANARLAEKEWSQAASRYRVQSFSAVPGINVVPTSQGVEVRVRYITRAHERHETRRGLYSSVVEMLHGKRD